MLYLRYLGCWTTSASRAIIPGDSSEYRLPKSKPLQMIYVFMRIPFFLISMLAFKSAVAGIVEGGPNDYYDPSPRVREVVGSVESLHLNKAVAHLKEGNITLACSELDFTLRWFPNHPRGLQFATQLFSQYSCPGEKDGDYYFKAALKLSPDNGTIHTLYGVLLHRKGLLDKALEQYQLALVELPDSADLHYNMGLMYIEKKEYQNALQHAQKAYALGHPLPGLRNKLVALKVWPQKNSN